ncbi:MAG: uracil-DNA glycosylase [Patescibacteria group bacterium]|nr:uracil-DNA glycosylase [Patescibacteria group bacterium]
MTTEVNIEPEWKKVLASYFASPGFKKVSDLIRQEYLSKTIYPRPENIFKAFWLTPFSQVKVVILGQDPYHGPHQAHGLCFSVPDSISPPPSLKNIFKEIEADLGRPALVNNGNLEPWAKQGVLLLNAILTVVANAPASHKNCGWEKFTDTVIKTLSKKRDHLVFILWGNYARSKKNLIDVSKHLIIEAPHPSPLSAYSGFFGSRPFSQTNNYLKKQHQKEIVW